MSYTDFRNIRVEPVKNSDWFHVFSEVSDSNTRPRSWVEMPIASERKADPWQLLPDRLYELAKGAASGSIKINGRTVSGSQFLAAFERGAALNRTKKHHENKSNWTPPIQH